MNNKKRNNKGFSLVELIVVVAIMAVLVGVLAPAYLSYVEKSRAQKDESALEEVKHAVEVALAEEAVYTELVGATGGLTVTIKDGEAVTTTGTNLTTSVKAVVPNAVDLVSKEHNGKTYTIAVTYDDTNKKFTIDPSWD